MFCPNCGTQNPDSANFCTKCGGALDEARRVANLAAETSDDIDVELEPPAAAPWRRSPGVAPQPSSYRGTPATAPRPSRAWKWESPSGWHWAAGAVLGIVVLICTERPWPAMHTTWFVAGTLALVGSLIRHYGN